MGRVASMSRWAVLDVCRVPVYRYTDPSFLAEVSRDGITSSAHGHGPRRAIHAAREAERERRLRRRGWPVPAEKSAKGNE